MKIEQTAEERPFCDAPLVNLHKRATMSASDSDCVAAGGEFSMPLSTSVQLDSIAEQSRQATNASQ